MDPIIPYKKNTDVQQTWREHGWKPPSEDPTIVQKWNFYKTLGVRDVPSKDSPDRGV